MIEIKEESIETKFGNGVFYSAVINGNVYKSQIVLTDNLNDKSLIKWKERSKNQLINTIKNETSSQNRS